MQNSGVLRYHSERREESIAIYTSFDNASVLLAQPESTRILNSYARDIYCVTYPNQDPDKYKKNFNIYFRIFFDLNVEDDQKLDYQLLFSWHFATIVNSKIDYRILEDRIAMFESLKYAHKRDCEDEIVLVKQKLAHFILIDISNEHFKANASRYSILNIRYCFEKMPPVIFWGIINPLSNKEKDPYDLMVIADILDDSRILPLLKRATASTSTQDFIQFAPEFRCKMEQTKWGINNSSRLFPCVYSILTSTLFSYSLGFNATLTTLFSCAAVYAFYHFDIGVISTYYDIRYSLSTEQGAQNMLIEILNTRIKEALSKYGSHLEAAEEESLSAERMI